MPTGDTEDEVRHKEAMGIGRRKAGRFDDIIDKHAKRVGLDPEYMKRIMKIESGGDPGNKTGSYKGLFQLDEKEFKKHGGGINVYDPEENTMAAANMFAQQKLEFKERYGRDPKPIDMYMIHQQGKAGYSAHMANPDRPAWENVRQYYGSDAVAKKAIWGNVPDKDKAKFGSVENVSSSQFVNDVWAGRVEGGEAEFGGTAMAGARSRSREGGDYSKDAFQDAKGSFLEGKKKGSFLGFAEEDEFKPKVSGLTVPNLVPHFTLGKV